MRRGRVFSGNGDGFLRAKLNVLELALAILVAIRATALLTLVAGRARTVILVARRPVLRRPALGRRAHRRLRDT